MTEKTEQRFECLRDALITASPLDEASRRSIAHLCRVIGIKYQSAHYWIKADRLPPRRVNDIVAASQGRVTVEDLLPFVL